MEDFGPLETRSGVMDLYYFGYGSDPHLHLTMTTSGVAGDYLAGIVLPSKFGLYLDPVKALSIILKHMK